MKTFTITLILVMSMLFAQSNPFGSSLEITSNQHSLIRVALDNGPLSPPKAKIKFFDLAAGNHRIQIVRHSAHPGMHPNRVIYKGRIHIQPSSITQAMIGKFGNFHIRNIKPLFNAYHTGNNNSNSFCGMNGCGLSSGHMSSCQTAAQPCGYSGCSFALGHSGMHGANNSSCRTYYSQNDSGFGQSNWNNQSYFFGPQHMRASEFNLFVQTLRNQSFDSTRLKIAKQVVSQNYLNTAQVAEVMRLFSFESNRLDLAKFAYGHTVDKENYYWLSNSFDFNSSINQLMNFIGNG